MYFINEIELQLDAAGTANFHMDVPPDADLRNGQALVVIERLPTLNAVPPENGEAVTAYVDMMPQGNISKFTDIAVFAGMVTNPTEGISVGITGQVGERYRIFVGWARRNFREARENLSCTICRKALKAAIRAAFAWVGIPTPGEILGELAGQLLDGLRVEGIAAFLRELFGDDLIIDRLGHWLDQLLGFIRAIDEICRALCRKMGYCP